MVVATEVLDMLGEHEDLRRNTPAKIVPAKIVLYQAANASGFFVAVSSGVAIRILYSS